MPSFLFNMMYLAKTPGIVKPVYKDLVWNIPQEEKVIYLTFDDGPVPEVTPKVLDVLLQFNIKATFFCIGDNVQKHPELFHRLLNEGHRIGNHTNNHLNGWKCSDMSYLRNVLKCAEYVNSDLFRPPYGKIKRSQATALKSKYKIVMWDVLSGDFDPYTPPEKCVHNVLDNVANGSIIVFHDSIKAANKMLYALPIVLEQLLAQEYRFEVIP